MKIIVETHMENSCIVIVAHRYENWEGGAMVGKPRHFVEHKKILVDTFLEQLGFKIQGEVRS